MGLRIAILGTAPSWMQLPWDDPGLRIKGLNDAYLMGLPRVDEWYELHPLDRLVMAPAGAKVDTPPGWYRRPPGYLDWLGQLTVPLYLQAARPEWPHSRTFPLEEVLALWRELPFERLNRYHESRPAPLGGYTSTPALMVGHAILEDAEEIQVWGIHLATEREYIEQRPAMEAMLMLAASRGIRVVLPTASPLLKGGCIYGFEPRPSDEAAALRRDVGQWQLKARQHAAAAHAQPRWAWRERERLRAEARDYELAAELAADRLRRHERLRVWMDEYDGVAESPLVVPRAG